MPTFTTADALRALENAWPAIREECRAVIGTEALHQAIIYRCLRETQALARTQIGVEVPFTFVRGLPKPRTRKPDLVLFAPATNGAFKEEPHIRRHARLAIELKSAETFREKVARATVAADVDRLLDLRRLIQRARRQDGSPSGQPIALVAALINTSPTSKHRLRSATIDWLHRHARERGVGFMCVGYRADRDILDIDQGRQIEFQTRSTASSERSRSPS